MGREGRTGGVTTADDDVTQDDEEDPEDEVWSLLRGVGRCSPPRGVAHAQDDGGEEREAAEVLGLAREGDAIAVRLEVRQLAGSRRLGSVDWR